VECFLESAADRARGVLLERDEGLPAQYGQKQAMTRLFLLILRKSTRQRRKR
jgi:hypothetical protein